MANKKIIIPVGFQFEDISAAVKEAKTKLSSIKIESGIGQQYTKTFSRLEQEIESIQKKAARGISSQSDIDSIERSLQTVVGYVEKIQSLSGKINFKDVKLTQDQLNTYNQLNSENFCGIPCAFRTASQKFSVIEDAKVIAIIILYDEKAESLVREYNDKKYLPTQNKIALIKKMQKYSISVYKYEYDELCKNHALSVTEDGHFFYLSNKSFYDNNIGIVLSAKLEFIEL